MKRHETGSFMMVMGVSHQANHRALNCKRNQGDRIQAVLIEQKMIPNGGYFTTIVSFENGLLESGPVSSPSLPVDHIEQSSETFGDPNSRNHWIQS
jgi:hypothetical protein